MFQEIYVFLWLIQYISHQVQLIISRVFQVLFVTYSIVQHISPLQGLLHQFLCTGLYGGQHTLVVGPLTDVAAKDLQDTGDRHLTGQLCRVVCSLEVTGQAPAAQRLTTASAVGAVVENSWKPVVVAADFALGRLPDTNALCGADSGVRVVGPERDKRRRPDCTHGFMGK